MKLRIVNLTPESLSRMLQANFQALTENLPRDTEIFDVKMDLAAKQVTIVVRSESFSDVAENQPIPEFAISERKLATIPTAKSEITVNPQVTPESVTTTPTVAKLPVPQPSRMASKMENEFTPEQRKLLSFTIREDAVVVKPVTFLKAEWDDINDVVRSIGGKWVKGDIISYWEIPLE